MKHPKKLVISLSILCLLLFGAVCFFIYRGNYLTAFYNTVNEVPYSYLDNAQYTQRETLFESSPVKKADIVFVGDSITARGEWQEFYPDKVVLNRGIDSDITEGVLNRLDVIIKTSPDEIYLMIGINDLRQHITHEASVSNYEKILQKLTQSLPNCTIYVQSILPVRSTTGIANTDVQALNADIKTLADSYGLTYVDLYSLLVDENNDLPEVYSVDGVHMTGDGYQIWLDALTAL